jgi:uncharacterized protein
MTKTSRRGFASMDPERQREIASKGGRTAHAKGTAHKFTSEEAKKAGRKGGQSVSQDRNHMSTIGRTGGKNSRRGMLEVKFEPQEQKARSIGDALEIPEAV